MFALLISSHFKTFNWNAENMLKSYLIRKEDSAISNSLFFLFFVIIMYYFKYDITEMSAILVFFDALLTNVVI